GASSNNRLRGGWLGLASSSRRTDVVMPKDISKKGNKPMANTEAKMPPPTPMATSAKVLCNEAWEKANPSPISMMPRMAKALAQATSNPARVKSDLWLTWVTLYAPTILQIRATTRIFSSFPAIMAMRTDRVAPKNKDKWTSKMMVIN